MDTILECYSAGKEVYHRLNTQVHRYMHGDLVIGDYISKHLAHWGRDKMAATWFMPQTMF